MKRPVIFFIGLALLSGVAWSSPVERYGRLHASGAKIVGADGRPVSLAGSSLFWSQWEGEFWNAACIDWLKQDWNATIIRAAVGVEGGGYLEHPAREQARVEKVVDACIAAGLYVIIDWHDHNAQRHAPQAEAFFQAMARKYGERPNVMYEIFNEPLKVSWHNDVKPYSERIVAAIRAIDPDNLIIVGSPRWSQDVDVAADDPIRDVNLAYSLHFYAGTHKRRLRNKAEHALRKGVALFVTEWGTCDSDGKGKVDEVSTREWMEFMRRWQLSHCNWAVSDKKETASIVVPGAAVTGGWRANELTKSGSLVRDYMRGWAGGEAGSTRPVVQLSPERATRAALSGP